VLEKDRRSHGKNQQHKNNKESLKTWVCEDCQEFFVGEQELIGHFQSKVHRRIVSVKFVLGVMTRSMVDALFPFFKGSNSAFIAAIPSGPFPENECRSLG